MTEDKYPLVAIGVPVYNGAEFLDECLTSLCNQTYTNWCCIILDNCSNDGSGEIAKKFVHKDTRFIYESNDKLLDVMLNWNKVFSFIPAETRYFKIIPADDWIMPEFLAEMVSTMERNPKAGICSSYRIDDSKVRGEGLNWYEGNYFSGKRVLTDELNLKIDVTGSGNSVLYKVSYLKLLPKFPQIFSSESIHGDTELAYDLLSVCDLAFIYKVLSYTRRHEASITTRIASKLNTSACFRDNMFLKYADIIENFEGNYRQHRLSYATFYMKKLFSGDKKSLQWHTENLKNPILKTEIIAAILNLIFVKIFRRSLTFKLNNIPVV
jgi:glycosyltransferase involved in cell wall biosynthesis